MQEKFYTIDKVAEMLGMHHKTIRKFIAEGRLRANKVGKQWRISGHDLSIFVESNNINIGNRTKVEDAEINFSTNESESTHKANKVNVSTVIDIHEIDIDEHRRISNMLLAAMNTKDPKMNHSTINLKHYEKENNLKVMLWGDIEFVKEMLDFIAILTQRNEK